jgi:hypothetical protein
MPVLNQIWEKFLSISSIQIDFLSLTDLELIWHFLIFHHFLSSLFMFFTFWVCVCVCVCVISLSLSHSLTHAHTHTHTHTYTHTLYVCFFPSVSPVLFSFLTFIFQFFPLSVNCGPKFLKQPLTNNLPPCHPHPPFTCTPP